MRIGKENGFTLIELLIAMTIFAVGLLSLAGMQITAIQTNSDASVRTAASALAGGILEEVLTWERDDARLSADVSNQAWDFGGGTNIKELSGAGRCVATYSVLTGTPVDAVATVTVRVAGTGVRPVELTVLKRTN